MKRCEHSTFCLVLTSFFYVELKCQRRTVAYSTVEEFSLVFILTTNFGEDYFKNQHYRVKNNMFLRNITPLLVLSTLVLDMRKADRYDASALVTEPSTIL